MIDGQLYSLAERFVLSFEKLAVALSGLDETYRRYLAKQYPERAEVRQAVVTRVPNEEDLIREGHGAGNQPLDEWLSDLGEEEDLGVREREWIEAQKRIAGAQGSE